MTLGDPRRSSSISYKLRSKRDVLLRSIIDGIHARKKAVAIIDLGGSLDYWRRVGFAFLVEKHATVTIVNLDETELTAPDAPAHVFQSRLADACSLTQFSDQQFDLAHSNSVIEHVGSWSNMKAFAGEVRRVGISYYVQTPFFWFPVDPHFYTFPLFHWLPRPVRVMLLNSLPIATAGRIPGVDMANEVIDHTQLLDGRQFRFLFPDAELKLERFCGLAKSMIAIRLSDDQGSPELSENVQSISKGNCDCPQEAIVA
jgi:hypothetical protein